MHWCRTQHRAQLRSCTVHVHPRIAARDNAHNFSDVKFLSNMDRHKQLCCARCCIVCPDICIAFVVVREHFGFSESKWDHVLWVNVALLSKTSSYITAKHELRLKLSLQHTQLQVSFNMTKTQINEITDKCIKFCFLLNCTNDFSFLWLIFVAEGRTDLCFSFQFLNGLRSARKIPTSDDIRQKKHYRLLFIVKLSGISLFLFSYPQTALIRSNLTLKKSFLCCWWTEPHWLHTL